MGSSGEETSSPQNRLAQRRGGELVLVGADGPEIRKISRHCDIVADDGLDGDRNLNGRVDIRPLADNPEIRGLSQSTRAQGKGGHTCKKQRFQRHVSSFFGSLGPYHRRPDERDIWYQTPT